MTYTVTNKGVDSTASHTEALWNGDFGDAYHERNPTEDRRDFWRTILMRKAFTFRSVLELGAGKGDNLDALRDLRHCDTFGVDINRKACEVMASKGHGVYHGSGIDREIIDLIPMVDLVITRGFLIHLSSGERDAAFARMVTVCRRYIIMAEYYAPFRREVHYHGNSEALWADDFAGEFLRRYPHFELLDYGFDYHLTGGDDLTWFLLEKK